MPKRVSSTARIVEFFMTASLAEAQQALEVAKTLVATRRMGEALPGEMQPARRKPKAKSTATPTEDRVQ